MKITVVGKRFLVMFLGLMLMSIGVAISKLASLGTSPIASIPNVLSFLSPLQIGQASLIFLVLLVFLEAVVLRQFFSWKNLVQLIPAALFSLGIDFFVRFLRFLTPHFYWEQLLMTLISVFILALGVFFEVNSQLFVMPGEGISLAIAFMKNRAFSKIKIIVDTCMVIIAISLALSVTHQLVGVREGTIIAAILTGHCVSFLEKQTWLTQHINHFVENYI